MSTTSMTSISGRVQQPDTIHTGIAKKILVAGVISGILLHILVWDRSGGGLGVLLWTLSSCIAVCWINQRQATLWRKELSGWCLLMSLATVPGVLYDAVAVKLLGILVMALCLGMVFYRTTVGNLRDARLMTLARTAIRLPGRVVTGCFPVLESVLSRRKERTTASRLPGILRGVLITIPLMFVFINLLSSADAVFSQQISRMGAFVGALAPETPFISVVLILACTGLLSCTVPRLPTETPNPRAPLLRLGNEEIAIIMGSLTLLFSVFVVLQASYLFGGRELIESRSGLTLAAYARQGFFELLVVAGLTLGILMTIAALQSNSSSPFNRRLFQSLGTMMIGCVMVILLSALFRLSLYVEQFGLTLSRLMALALMLWLAGALVWFAVTLLRGRNTGFMSGLLFGAIACCLLLSISNPVARVADINVRHAQASGMPLDMDYLVRLGADSVPALMHYIENARPATQCHYAGQWLTQLNWHLNRHPLDWRDWNAGRHQALRLLQERARDCV